MNLDFNALLLPAPRSGVFRMDGWMVWCGSLIKRGAEYYLYFSRWPASFGHQGWVTNSEIAYAVGRDLFGPFEYRGTVLAGAGGDSWDADVTHNPVVLEADGAYYLYYMGNRGNGSYWSHRNNQRIGVAVATSPEGPWIRSESPLVDVSPGSWDHLMVSNPTVARGGDGLFYMIYKGVGDGPLPKGGAVVLGLAVAEHPTGPFRKIAGPLLANPEHPWSLEDPFLWHDGERFLLLAKDFQGFFTGRGPSTVALFESMDAVDWKAAANAFAFDRCIKWEDGEMQSVDALERPFIYFENGTAAALLCAVGIGPDRADSFNVRIPLVQQMIYC
jgi:hypothetical protein